MDRLGELFRAVPPWRLFQHVGPGVRRSGLGFVLVVVLSLMHAVTAQAQTDSGSGSKPTLTIARSHALVVKGEEVTLTITADRAPTADISVNVQVQVSVRERSLYQSKLMTVSLAAGEREIELIAETGGSEVGAGTLRLEVSILGSSGYRLGDTPVVGVRVTDPPPAAGTRQGVPAAPTGFAASAEDDDSIAVSWAGVAGVSRYRLEEHLGTIRVDLWRVVGGQGSIVQTSATVEGLRSGTTYAYRVRAHNAAGWGAPSASASATTQGSQTQAQAVGSAATLPTPKGPSGFTASAPNHFTIEASWDEVSGADNYRFGIWLGNPGGWNYVETTELEYTWTNRIARGTRYSISVAAHGDGSTLAAVWGPPSWGNVTTPRPTPAAPGGFSGSATGTRSISASWNRVPEASKYEFGIEIASLGGWQKKDVPRGTTSTTWSRGLAPNTTYNIRVRAHGDGGWLKAVWGPYSLEKVTTDATPEPPEEPPPAPSPSPNPTPTPTPTPTPPPVGCGARPTQLAQPTNVTVIPLARREAKLQWDDVCHADRYIVQVRRHQQQLGGGGWTRHQSTNRPTSSTSITIVLDDVLPNGNGLADDPYAYQFRVKAQHSTNASSESIASDIVIVTDSPILRADGNSTNGDRVTLKWTQLTDPMFLGSGYAGGSYRFIVRNVSVSDANIRHTVREWTQPSDPPVTSSSAVNNRNEITGLTAFDLYAIQLEYTVDKEGKTIRVYAGRDAYVWPSNRTAGGGERVATFPLNYPLTRTSSGIYEFRYRICKDTFDSLSNGTQSEWVTLINHAFNQWQSATDGLVRMVVEAGDCADYSPFVTHLVDQISPKITSGEDRDKIRDYASAMVDRFRVYGLLDLSDLTNIQRHFLPLQDDASRNEVIMVHDTDDAIKLITTEAPTNFSSDLGLSNCDGGCAVRSDHNGGSTTDIFLQRTNHDNALIIRTGKEKVRFNKCPNFPDPMGRGYNYPYSSLVHEAGHALGIRGGTDGTGQERGHPPDRILSSIMSYSRGKPKCSPHPLDILAIFALYQSG